MKGHTGRRWREIAFDLDLRICDGHGPCRKKWSFWMHEQGRVDAIGVAHWDGWNRLADRKGLRRVLMMAALGRNRPYREEARKWMRIYLCSVWATWAAKHYLHRQLEYKDDRKDRLLVRQLARTEMSTAELRRAYPTISTWIYYRPRSVRGTLTASGGAMVG